MIAAGQPVNTFLVPDISGGERTSKAVLKAAQAAAEAMSTGELLARAAAEIGGTWFLAWLLKITCARLGDAALQACLHHACAHGSSTRSGLLRCSPACSPCWLGKTADTGKPSPVCHAERSGGPAGRGRPRQHPGQEGASDCITDALQPGTLHGVAFWASRIMRYARADCRGCNARMTMHCTGVAAGHRERHQRGGRAAARAHAAGGRRAHAAHCLPHSPDPGRRPLLGQRGATPHQPCAPAPPPAHILPCSAASPRLQLFLDLMLGTSVSVQRPALSLAWCRRDLS